MRSSLKKIVEEGTMGIHDGMKTLLVGTGAVLFFSLTAYALEPGGGAGGGKAAPAAQSNGMKETKEQKPASSSPLFVYKPPMRGKPGNRVGGGTRGTGSDLPVIAALVPDHTGLTTRKQPSFFWYLSRTTGSRIEFTLNSEQQERPVLEVKIDAERPGIQRIDLSRYSVSLVPGIEYQWFIALIPDPDQRSKDSVVTGTVKYVGVSEELSTLIAERGREGLPGVYAGRGIWYDALASLEDLIASDPGNRGLAEQRSLLLRQVGLPEIPGLQ
ncbi:MAG: DUF928 domain-containing protein [Alphaproteobacteria bacterium]|uniref:DUF928 domain-containing protein n=1 Tax=Candidatus Nitrobium versatile TaxID=2884831 RepID=A0A953SDH4_9BACT|nr:DUF928 domain-containing protein [Candidatus Nitrobium versatile]